MQTEVSPLSYSNDQTRLRSDVGWSCVVTCLLAQAERLGLIIFKFKSLAYQVLGINHDEKILKLKLWLEKEQYMSCD